MLRCALLRPTQRFSTAARLSGSDYGTDTTDPRGSQPQKQGANPSANREHPGPPPPKSGWGSGSTPTKGTREGHNTGESYQAQHKRNFGTMAARRAEDRPKTAEGLRPRILDDSAPKAVDEPEDVRRHNDELENRAERAHEGVKRGTDEKDKVTKGFWSGVGGKSEDAPQS
ncbi:hypothetical protein EJ06DRAFT_532196 [Trichodelitschia bisporula]|uniref:Uncharacterized protein n=1 Tax=Trichodelitschia bisporula TaxID=703511 RepID=A0A6G1HRH8_9PEZI|nr:hypothetical protein EJ06DRAFT_532196 [Trichodelitschia bisporula]